METPPIRPRALAAMGVLFLLSSIPGPALAKADVVQIPHLDKVVHGALYAVLAWSFRPTRRRRFYRSIGEWLPFAAGAALAFALTDELHQCFIAGRSPELLDLVADTVGVAVGAALATLRWPLGGTPRILQ